MVQATEIPALLVVIEDTLLVRDAGAYSMNN